MNDARKMLEMTMVASMVSSLNKDIMPDLIPKKDWDYQQKKRDKKDHCKQQQK